MSKLSVAAGLAAILAAAVFVSAPVRAESVMKECGKEWQAAKDAKTTGTQTWTEYLKDCRARHATTTAAAAPAAPAPTPTPTMAPTPKPMATKMSKAEPTAPAAGQFASEGEAKGHCPTDTVVWVNTKSSKYHYAGNRNYGTTKHGAYMCEADAKAAGDIAAHGEKPKG